MKLLKYTLIGLVTVMVIVVFIGFLLPSNHQISESIVIDAPVGTVFGEVNNFKHWNNWSPWQGKDPNAIISYDGPESGVGSKMVWHSDNPKVGKGSQEIMVSEPNKHIKTILKMVGWNTVSHGVWNFEELDSNRTKVTWEFNSQVGNHIFMKYMMILCKSALRKDYRTGLQQLKSHLEHK
ncbi:MAG: hypothetical protein BGO68_05685 [Candidatus Amoebophilus sp. 36-38]|nr:MAG: hypothetical protein BGO68_05685 [Candidatus Amoebophilus sp. 36-38]